MIRLGELGGAKRLAKAMEDGTIEIAPLAFMRGRTLKSAYVILDEGQNATAAQMKMFLTRLGEGSKMVVTGDPTQIDLPRNETSGLVQATQILEAVKGLPSSSSQALMWCVMRWLGALWFRLMIKSDVPA